eukprot:2323082-Amphidinium_carterae.2
MYSGCGWFLVGGGATISSHRVVSTESARSQPIRNALYRSFVFSHTTLNVAQTQAKQESSRTGVIVARFVGVLIRVVTAHSLGWLIYRFPCIPLCFQKPNRLCCNFAPHMLERLLLRSLWI